MRQGINLFTWHLLQTARAVSWFPTLTTFTLIPIYGFFCGMQWVNVRFGPLLCPVVWGVLSCEKRIWLLLKKKRKLAGEREILHWRSLRAEITIKSSSRTISGSFSRFKSTQRQWRHFVIAQTAEWDVGQSQMGCKTLNMRLFGMIVLWLWLKCWIVLPFMIIWRLMSLAHAWLFVAAESESCRIRKNWC